MLSFLEKSKATAYCWTNLEIEFYTFLSYKKAVLKAIVDF
ncbi:hypothetical protein BN000_03773 [Neobacillus massiliamazoniensis]|uniref:Uncharacterized protein n=1 Tax=Neobacillus massiliamazoniensis TaxID=1499688 RepID=A0A0U1P0F6_9BACI|nr:hypothetical protein BN000_03773 [Neobacillus massiliamazoniensis]